MHSDTDAASRPVDGPGLACRLRRQRPLRRRDYRIPFWFTPQIAERVQRE